MIGIRQFDVFAQLQPSHAIPLLIAKPNWLVGTTHASSGSVGTKENIRLRSSSSLSAISAPSGKSLIGIGLLFAHDFLFDLRQFVETPKAQVSD